MQTPPPGGATEVFRSKLGAVLLLVIALLLTSAVTIAGCAVSAPPHPQVRGKFLGFKYSLPYPAPVTADPPPWAARPDQDPLAAQRAAADQDLKNRAAYFASRTNQAYVTLSNGQQVLATCPFQNLGLKAAVTVQQNDDGTWVVVNAP
jgi:hypothetical protein